MIRIGHLRLRTNDLDFRYLPTHKHQATPRYAQLRALITPSRFFSRGADHIAFALDCAGEQGSGNPHCGPIVRRGNSLFATARGVVVAYDGSVLCEIWNGTASPLLVPIANQRPGRFDPSAHTFLAMRVRCHYAGGIEVRIRNGLGGVVFEGSVPSQPWPWTGSMRACIAGIAGGFVAPQETECVEQTEPRSAPQAKLGYVALASVCR